MTIGGSPASVRDMQFGHTLHQGRFVCGWVYSKCVSLVKLGEPPVVTKGMSFYHTPRLNRFVARGDPPRVTRGFVKDFAAARITILLILLRVRAAKFLGDSPRKPIASYFLFGKSDDSDCVCMHV